MWVAIHMCIEAMLRITLYSYLYLKLAKNCVSYYLICFLFKKIREQKEGTGSAWKWEQVWRKGEVAQTMYTHVSKCKNNKIKK
jgi:hypothetical protein